MLKLLRNTLLETFVTVVECGGFSDAQFALGITQSAISIRIRDLETGLGYRVCERGRAGFRLTERGEIAYKMARDILRSARDFDAELLELRNSIAGELRIGVVDAVSSLPGLPLVPALQTFLGRSNDVQLELLIASPNELTQKLISGEIHVAIAPFRNQLPDLNYVEVCTEEHRLYCSEKHAVFNLPAENINARLLSSYPLCQRSYDMMASTDLAASKAQVLVANMEAMAMLIESGHYLGALPAHYARQWVDRGVFRELRSDDLRWTSVFYLATRPNRSQRQAVKLFCDDVIDCIQNHKI